MVGRRETSTSHGLESRCKVGWPVICVETARVGQHPDERAGQAILLRSKNGAGAIERGSIGADADHRDDAGLIAPYLAFEPLPACSKLIGPELVSGNSGAGDEIGNAAPARQQFLLFPGLEPARRESGSVQGRPEPVAGPRKMVAGGGRVQAGIDAAEQDIESLCDHVTQCSTRRGPEIFRTRPAAFRRCLIAHSLILNGSRIGRQRFLRVREAQ